MKCPKMYIQLCGRGRKLRKYKIPMALYKMFKPARLVQRDFEMPLHKGKPHASLYKEVEKSFWTSQAGLNILYKTNKNFVPSDLALVAPTDNFFGISTLCTLSVGSNLSILSQNYLSLIPCLKQPYTKFVPVQKRPCAKFVLINSPVQIL